MINNITTDVQKARRIQQTVWPPLSDVGLTEGEKLRRQNYIGGSDANIIMSGDADRLGALMA